MYEKKVHLYSKDQISSKDQTSSIEEKIKYILQEAKRIKKQAEDYSVKIIEEARTNVIEITERNINEAYDFTAFTNNKIHKKQKPIGNRNKWQGIESSICSQDIFKTVLERERTRSDRNGHELSLILFDISEEIKAKTVRILIKALKSRARSIDMFGWYSEKYIGVVLPNTCYKDGNKFAHCIIEMMFFKKPQPPGFKVYSYSQKWLPEINGNGAIKRNNKNPENRKCIEGPDPIFIKKMPLWKRTLDVLGSITAMILLSPFFIIVPVLIKSISPGPVLFKQERVGQGGEHFTFLKFRTMKVNNDSTLHREYLNELIKSDKSMIKLDKEKDSRIIPLGRFIRKACIDELPQLFNVLKGEMSLIGPRPCLPYEANEYLKWHKYRFDIKPGMTGLWQVSGKNRLTFKEMIRLDIQYVKKMNIWLDLRILLQTAPVVISSIFHSNVSVNDFLHNMKNKISPNRQFKKFIKRYYSDIYSVDKLEFLDDKLKENSINLMELMLLLSKLDKILPGYNVSKRYFGIAKLIDYEKRSQSGDMETRYRL